MKILLWLVYMLATGGGAWWCACNSHPVGALVLAVLFGAGWVAVFGADVIEGDDW